MKNDAKEGIPNNSVAKKTYSAPTTPTAKHCLTQPNDLYYTFAQPAAQRLSTDAFKTYFKKQTTSSKFCQCFATSNKSICS